MERYILIACMTILSLTAQAQVDDFSKKYDNFRRKARQEYSDFRDAANKKYAEFLLDAWKQYKSLPEIPKPKDENVTPVIMPEYDKDKDMQSTPIVIDEVATTPMPEPQPVPVAPIPETPMKEKDYKFAFYGGTYNVRINEDAKFTIRDCSGTELSRVWKELSTELYNNTIRDCLELRIKLQLSDWAYLNMLDVFTKSVYGDSNEATFLMAYMYCQSGYSMRLGISENKLCMLYASKHTIYGQPYFRINGVIYYPYKCLATSMEICDASYPAEKPLSLFIASSQNFAYKASETRTLVSKRYPEVNVRLSVNKNLIDFYNTYPSSEIGDNFMTRWAIYANTPMEKSITESLYPEIKKFISGMTDKEAVERILNWVQTAFVYEYDDTVWGHDRAFFAEESLYYPFCDCEDRSILFTRLVRDLLGLKCILVYYPGHLASAVCFNENIDGDYIKLGDNHFIVCDPTYIGAPVGKTMPDMNNSKANIILLTSP